MLPSGRVTESTVRSLDAEKVDGASGLQRLSDQRPGFDEPSSVASDIHTGSRYSVDGCGSPRSEAGQGASSVRCTAPLPGCTIATRSWPACCHPIPRPSGGVPRGVREHLLRRSGGDRGPPRRCRTRPARTRVSERGRRGQRRRLRRSRNHLCDERRNLDHGGVTIGPTCTGNQHRCAKRPERRERSRTDRAVQAAEVSDVGRPRAPATQRRSPTN